MGKFNLSALLGAEPVSELDAMQVEEIALDCIRGNEDNFFDISDVDALADSIALIGLQQPLVVMRETLRVDGRMQYILLAGHRRLAALRQLGRQAAPCIVRSPACSELETLALIQTNTTARSLDYAARMEAVRRTEDALVSLKAKGYALPGRLRDRVAEITKEKASEIARMKVIDKSLSAPLRQALADGKLAPSAAYELAHLDAAGQERFAGRLAAGGTIQAREVRAQRDEAQPTAQAPVILEKDFKALDKVIAVRKESEEAAPAAKIWRPYPAERPAEGQTVLAYKDNGFYAELMYRGGAWYEPTIPECEMNVRVLWWSAELPPERTETC